MTRKAKAGDRLTPKEKSIMDLLEEGRSSADIGALLQISNHTVRNHLKNVFYKLNAHTRLEAVAAFRRVYLGDSRALRDNAEPRRYGACPELELPGFTVEKCAGSSDRVIRELACHVIELSREAHRLRSIVSSVSEIVQGEGSV